MGELARVQTAQHRMQQNIHAPVAELLRQEDEKRAKIEAERKTGKVRVAIGVMGSDHEMRSTVRGVLAGFSHSSLDSRPGEFFVTHLEKPDFSECEGKARAKLMAVISEALELARRHGDKSKEYELLGSIERPNGPGAGVKGVKHVVYFEAWRPAITMVCGKFLCDLVRDGTVKLEGEMEAVESRAMSSL